MRLETLDDVVFESDGQPREIIQTKHHLNGQARLTDGSEDLWKTLRIWTVARKAGQVPAGAALALLTTASAPEGSIAKMLGPGSERHEDEAHRRLLATAASSTNAANQDAYTEFKSLGPADQKALLSQVTIYDGQPDIIDLDSELHSALFFAVGREHQEHFLERLEGWWLKRVVANLSDADSAPILGEELDAEITRIRDQFRDDNLPVDDDILEAEVPASGFEDRLFVEQLRFIRIGNPRILIAIRDYFRAFEQRSRWIRQELVLVGELDRYEDRLLEEWELFFEQMRDELGAEPSEDAKEHAAQALYRWLETGTHIPIRPRVDHPSIPRGSYHMLADNARLGWHIEWRERLEALLERGGRT